MKKICRQNSGLGAHDKKAQIGQTLTWAVATIVILAILSLFVIGAGSEGFLKIFGATPHIEDKHSNFAVQQTLFAMLSQKAGGKTLAESIKEMTTEEDYNNIMSLAQKMTEQLKTKGLACTFEAVFKDVREIKRVSAEGRQTIPIIDTVLVSEISVGFANCLTNQCDKAEVNLNKNTAILLICQI